ncbi:hypothetical protein PC129_g11343 [Phytophthora cactorum]|uniref:Uncharacterized protein n=1 Tax=Phytophthora cactorum TaxID=29920 RepID=A0A8T1BWH1_9STRA|nr:hypothetical protein Pcac1_g11374 [Phytophthora cactorum]KAG2898666.1 hypothetical protein PC114_g14221 [Phytophthora cactorum]KAG2911591.1 hypothetical protein PC115_g12517 [Phytophthora cactorum]KAG2955018.1 hypothetical protein PC117_g766 [Phytophthora cactorum]KAG3013869.1 hypothetical protein PC120_g13046 [Phytophthora cactorum]
MLSVKAEAAVTSKEVAQNEEGTVQVETGDNEEKASA